MKGKKRERKKNVELQESEINRKFSSMKGSV